MKALKNIFVLFVLVVIATGCYSEDNWLNDNWEKTGEHYPNISNVTILNPQDSYSVGDQVSFDLRFWSEDPVDTITLFHQVGENDQEIATVYPYSEAAYSETTQTDSLILEYEVPQGASGSVISFEIIVENENELSASNTEATNTAIHNISIEVD